MIDTCETSAIIYIREQVKEATTKYFNGDDMAADNWVNKYAIKNSKDEYIELTPEDMHIRMAREFARIEKNYDKWLEEEDYLKLTDLGRKYIGVSEDEIFNLFKDFKYIVPQGSVMSVLGNKEVIGSLSNCVVIPDVIDSYGGICYTDQQLAQLFKRRCGVGVDISRLRPAKMNVSNAAGTTTGAVSFMKRFSNTTEEVGQNGRRGALMLTMIVSHPDILDFIKIKQDRESIKGANLSVRLTDEFMRAVERDEEFTLRWPVDKSPDEAEVSKVIKAKELWDEIIHSARNFAEPGLIFWDKHHEYSTSSIYPEYENASTNPCFTSDTKIAVADGRNVVTIGQLAKEGKDIPVYCVDDQGIVQIRTMRNPRLTGRNKKIVKVTLDDGSVVRCTENHKWYLSDGRKVQAKDLKPLDSLMISSKWQTNFDEMIYRKNNKSAKNYWMINSRNKNEFEHRFLYEQLTGEKIEDNVVHHKNHDGLDNSIANLAIMSKDEHDSIHDISGDKNPMRFWWNSATDEEKDRYRKQMSESTSGVKNGRYSGYTNEDILEKMIELIKDKGLNLSEAEWADFAKNNNYPQFIGGFRDISMADMLKSANSACGYLTFKDRYIQRNYNRYVKLLNDGQNVEFINGSVRYKKICIRCNEIFYTSERDKNNNYCSISCVNSSENKFNTYMIDSFISDNGIPASSEEFKSFIFDKYNISDIYYYKSFQQILDELSVRFNMIIKSYILKNEEYRHQINEKLNIGLCPFNHKVVSVEECGYEDVYCGTVDEFHNFGIILNEYETKSGNPKHDIAYVSNCGEIAMQGGDSCRLIAVNLYSFVENPFTKDAKFDYDKFYEVVYIAQKLNDDLVDLELERVSQIIKKIQSDSEPDVIKQIEIDTWNLLKKFGKRGRRTGLGFTAMADMIAAMGMKYDSDEAIVLLEEVMKEKCKAEFTSSIDMAICRGAFSDYDPEYEARSKFVDMLKVELPDVFSRMEKYGRRNISISTCAPTGTVSSLTQTSSGIEPVYALSMVRKRRINYTENTTDQPDIITDDNGEKWQQYSLDHPKLAKWKEVTGKDDIKESPYHGSTAEEISWKNRVRLQGVVQKYTTHSISSTINLPSDTTEDVVGGIYMNAWKEGLKGVTVYRDGSRQGIITKNKSADKQDRIQYSTAPKRPTILFCDIHYSNIQGHQWIFFVGMLHGVPYEIFGGCREDVSIPFKYKTAYIKKNSRDEKGRRKYDLYLDHPDSENSDGQKSKPLIKDLGQEFEPAGAFHTRFLSISLRHGVPIQFICEQLHKTTPTNMNSFEKGLARVLKKYISDGSVGSIKCSNCGSKLTYLEGCVKCLFCGESYCQ